LTEINESGRLGSENLRMKNVALGIVLRPVKNILNQTTPRACILAAGVLLPGRLLAQAPATADPTATRLPGTTAKTRVYGEVGFGVNKILLYGGTRDKLVRALGGSADFGTANNLLAAFFVAPEKWRGLGVGFHMSGTFGAPVTGDYGDQYIFNAYNVAVAAKYYPLSQEFNRGLYGRTSVGFGQFTTKRFRDDNQSVRHQYALGTSLMAGVGYTVPFKGLGISLEAEYERASRDGSLDRVGELTFDSGQLGVNLVVSF
jgi:hypothetical protein